jgi:hypothetical protein
LLIAADASGGLRALEFHKQVSTPR